MLDILSFCTRSDSASPVNYRGDPLEARIMVLTQLNPPTNRLLLSSAP